jgi:hypothetical protein
MNLPGYFLADMPQDARLTPSLIQEATQSLRRNREAYLSKRTTDSIIRTLARLAEDWCSDDFPLRRLALAEGPGNTGFSREILAAGLTQLFRQVTISGLHALLEQELGHAQRLDHFAPAHAGTSQERAAWARGPELLVHVAAGKVPNPALISIMFGLLLRSAQFMKCASGSAFLPRLFAHSIYAAEPKLGACLEIAEWPGGDRSLEDPLFQAADAITATGHSDTIAAIRRRVAEPTPVLGYGNRVSFGYITRASLDAAQAREAASAAARDVVAWDQLGCLSPHLFYVEQGGATSPGTFASLLAEQLARLETSAPRGPVPLEISGAIATRRKVFQTRAAHNPESRCWFSERSTAWSVVYENAALFQLSCLHRFVHVLGVENLDAALAGADAVRREVSTVGLAACRTEAAAYAHRLAAWGARRVCPLGAMQRPPLPWRHDGRPPLGDLILWTDWEP